MRCEQSLLSRPDGSAAFHQGDTAVIASIYGPAEVLIRKELVDRATVEVSYCNKVGLPSVTNRAIEAQLREIFQFVIVTALHPRTCIRIVVQEVCDSGSLTAASINATCLALLDAAVPLRHTVAAVLACVTNED